MKDHVWFYTAFVCFFLSTFLPIWIKNNELRRKVNLFLLIPVCFVIMFYVYPAGIELFKKIALTFK